MGGKKILRRAIELKPEERFMLVEGLLKSLDSPDHQSDEIWAKKAEKRLIAYREGKLAEIPMEEMFTS
ncbi:MAG: addiction module protein [Deltaproteobacteria bacterium]|nr:addiction module protein [Deltaproteobacteria bacterium]